MKISLNPRKIPQKVPKQKRLTVEAAKSGVTSTAHNKAEQQAVQVTAVVEAAKEAHFPAIEAARLGLSAPGNIAALPKQVEDAREAVEARSAHFAAIDAVKSGTIDDVPNSVSANPRPVRGNQEVAQAKKDHAIVWLKRTHAGSAFLRNSRFLQL